MRKSLQVLLAVGGATAIFISILHVIFGPACIPGSIPVNATMDSEDRFYGTLFGAYGAALLWCIKDIEHKGLYVRLLALVFFIGGLARIVSVIAVGLPNTFFITMTIIELILPFIMVLMNSRVQTTSQT
jgi:hypothetical protein